LRPNVPPVARLGALFFAFAGLPLFEWRAFVLLTRATRENFIFHFYLLAGLAAIHVFVLVYVFRRGAPDFRKKAGLLLGGAAAALVLTEAVFRLFLIQWFTPRNEADFHREISSYWPVPVNRQKPDTTFRILGLSDSYGRIGEDGNYHYRLEKILGQKGGRVDLVNFSLYEYDPPDELDLLKRFGPGYDYDLVLHGFFAGNDFSSPKGAIVKIMGLSARHVPGVRSWLPHNLVSLTWLYRSLVYWRDRRGRKREQAAGAGEGSFSHREFLNIERRRLETCRRGNERSGAWALTASTIDKIRSEARKNGARYALVLHPDQIQVEDALFSEIVSTFNLDTDLYDLDLPQAFLRRTCADAGIPCLDLLPYLREQGRGGGLYMKRDTHYNAAGNNLAAEKIAAFLIEAGLVPAAPVRPAAGSPAP
jgi:hypothetical protein